MAGLLRLVLMTALLSALAACATQAEREEQRTGEGALQGLAPHDTTAAAERPTATGGETTATTDVPAPWDYVALGDSQPVARRGRKATDLFDP